MSLTDRKAAEDVLNSFIEENTYSAKSGEESVAFVSPEIIDKEIGSIGGMMIVTRKTGDDHLGLVLQRQLFDLIVVDLASGFVQAILHRLIQSAREIDLGAVGEMAAMRQAHA